MRRSRPALLLALGLCPLVGCTGGSSDDDDSASDVASDDDDAAQLPFVVSMYPADGELDFFYRDDMRVEFDRGIDEFAYRVTGPDGDVPVDVTLDAERRVMTVDPVEDLLPLTAYQVQMTWSPAASAEGYSFSFSTGLSGLEVDTDALTQVVFLVDLAAGTWVEPAGVGGFVANQLGDWVLLMQVTEQSQLGLEEQPGLHILGAGAENGEDGLVQPACSEGLRMTAGPDRVVGSADDVPGTLDNPGFDFGPTWLAMMVNSSLVAIDQTTVSGLFELDLASITGLRIAGVIDTRALDGMLPGEPTEGAVCELVWETAEIVCQECGEPTPGAFCLDAVVEDIPATATKGVEIVDRTCAELIQTFIDSGGCASEAAVYDPAGDGSYSGCPLWSQR